VGLEDAIAREADSVAGCGGSGCGRVRWRRSIAVTGLAKILPTDRHPTIISLPSGVLGVCWGGNATTSSRSRVYGFPGPGPRDHFRPIPANRAANPTQLALDHAPRRIQVEVSPMSHPPVFDLQSLGAAPLADPPAATQPDLDDHSLAAGADVLHRRSQQAEHPLEWGADPRVDLRPVADLRTASRLPQKRRRRVASPAHANPERELRATEPFLTGRSRATGPIDSPPDRQESPI